MTVKQAVDAFMRAARQVVGDDMPPNVESWWRGYDLRRKRSRAYRTPPPVYAECPSCRATVRVLPSGRWARHPDSILNPLDGRRIFLRGRCKAGGRMADVAPCPDPECTRRGQHGDHWKLSHGHLVKWA